MKLLVLGLFPCLQERVEDQFDCWFVRGRDKMSVSPDEIVDHLLECLAFNGDEGK